jgi:hypothetical protein
LDIEDKKKDLEREIQRAKTLEKIKKKFDVSTTYSLPSIIAKNVNQNNNNNDNNNVIFFIFLLY